MAMNPADHIVETVNADFNDPVKVDTILNKWTTSTDKASTPATATLGRSDQGVGFRLVRVSY
jgi:hypothetical protein